MTQPATNPEAESDERYNAAVDWLINNVELDTQIVFWAFIDGKITRDELDRFTTTDVVERETQLAEQKGAETR